MVADVAPAAGGGVAPQEVSDAGSQGRGAAAALQVVSTQTAQGGAEQPGQVVAVPVAVQVGGRRPQAAPRKQPAVEAVTVHGDLGAQLGRGLGDAGDEFARAVADTHPAGAEIRQAALHEPPGQPADGPRAAGGPGNGGNGGWLTHGDSLLAGVRSPDGGPDAGPGWGWKGTPFHHRRRACQ